MAVSLIRRGDIFLIFLTHFGPARAGEPDFKRPAVVITNNVANARADALTVIPLTSNLKSVYDFQLLLPTERCGQVIRGQITRAGSDTELNSSSEMSEKRRQLFRAAQLRIFFDSLCFAAFQVCSESKLFFKVV